MNTLDTVDVRNVERMDRATKLRNDRRHRDNKETLAFMERVSTARRYLEGVCRCGAAFMEGDICDYCDEVAV